MNIQNQKDEKLEELCPECNSNSQDVSKGSMTCSQCGLVYGTYIETSIPGERCYSKEQEDDRAHYGPPISVLTPDIALTTYPDFSKTYISNGRLKKILKKSGSYQGRVYTLAVKRLKLMQQHFNVSNIEVVESMKLFRKLWKQKKIQGVCHIAVICAIVKLVSRYYNKVYTLVNMANLFDIEVKNIVARYKAILSFIKEQSDLFMIETEFRKNLSKKGINKEWIQEEWIHEIMVCLNYYIAEFPDLEVLREDAIEIIKSMNRLKNQGKKSMGLVAAVLYNLIDKCDLNITQEELAEKGGISIVTLRDTYQRLILQENFEKLKFKTKIPDDLLKLCNKVVHELIKQKKLNKIYEKESLIACLFQCSEILKIQLKKEEILQKMEVKLHEKSQKIAELKVMVQMVVMKLKENKEISDLSPTSTNSNR